MAYDLNETERYQFLLRTVIYEASKLYQTSLNTFKLMLHTDPKSPTGKKLGLSSPDARNIWMDMTSGSLEAKLGAFYTFMTPGEKKIIQDMGDLLRTMPEGTPLPPTYVLEQIIEESKPAVHVTNSSKRVESMVENAQRFAAAAEKHHAKVLARTKRQNGT